MLREQIIKLWSSLKFHSLFGHITSVFFYFFSLSLLTVGSVPERLQVRKIADICLLKFRIVCFFWSSMSGLRYNTSDPLYWEILWAAKIRSSDKLLNLVKCQSTVKENYIIFSNYTEWLEAFVLYWVSEERI